MIYSAVDLVKDAIRDVTTVKFQYGIISMSFLNLPLCRATFQCSAAGIFCKHKEE